MLVQKSTLFPLFRCNFLIRNTHAVSTYFFRLNFEGQKIHFVCTYFFRRNFDGQNFGIVFVSGKLMKTFGEVFFVNNFKKLTFTRLFSLMYLSSIEIWVLQPPPYHCKKNCCKLVFWVFTEQLLYQIVFGWLPSCEVTLVKKRHKPILQKSETKVFDQKRFIQNLFKANEKNDSGVLRINQIISKSLTLSESLQLNC